MALTCPQCAAPMNEVKAEANAGYLILLDQCPGCGGIWCDRWELYPVTAEAAARLDAVDTGALQQSAPPDAERLTCPRCRARMFRFRDPLLPADARIERCPNCDGIWLNRGELRRFKDQHNGAAGQGDPGVSDEAKLDHLAHHTLGDPRAWPTVQSWNDIDAPAAVPNGADVRGEVKSTVLWVIVRAALRLLLHI